MQGLGDNKGAMGLEVSVFLSKNLFELAVVQQESVVYQGEYDKIYKNRITKKEQILLLIL